MSKVTCCRCRWNPFRRCEENTVCASCCNILSKLAQKCVEKKWILVINVFCKSSSGLNIAAGMRRPLPQMHCHRYPPAKLNKSKRKERHVLFPYFCFGFIGAKIKMIAYFLQTCIHSIIKLYGICRHISHSNCIFQFSEEWMQETAEMTRFNLPLSWTKAEWVMGYMWSFWFQENLNGNKFEEKNSGQIFVASKGDFVKVWYM